ncbi:LuxR C-terminal-related transcriptional regulator [Streptomyces sp. NPDC057638]|uniref:LuxR C-terminal-related transcriptional regulator n=1 Tax=Streptomyces sp. NPDC057638 TaxID=3346190 RepID=UPI003698BD06
MNDTSEVTVVIVDEDPVFRLGMTALLGSVRGLSVVAEAATTVEAVAVVERHRPRVVVMDLRAGPGRESGVDAARQVLRLRPQPAVLVMTGVDDGDSVLVSLRTGARGYLLKGASAAEVERAVRAVANGEILLGHGVARHALACVAGPHPGGRAPVLCGLTPREHEVLDQVARGLDNEMIARRLALSPKTVRNHVSTILTKLQVNSRAQAIVRAREAGLGGDGPGGAGLGGGR